jgi:hypothetical protein
MDNTELLKAMKEMMDPKQAKMDTKMKTYQEMLVKTEARIEDNNEKFEVLQGTLISQIDANQAEMKSTVSILVGKMDAWRAEIKDEQKEMMACQVTLEACLDSKEPNLEDMESEVDRPEVPMEEATVKSSGTMKKWHRGQHLAAGQ